MTPRFIECLRFVLEREGGRVDHKADKGGRTAFGVTQQVYADWCTKRNQKAADVWDIRPFEVLDIYWDRYWKPVRGDDLPHGVDLVVFDCAVNSGPSQAARWLQRAVGAKDDGVIGIKTLAALADHDSGYVKRSVIDQRDDFYRAIVDRNPTQSVFLKGWLARNDHLREAVA